MLDGKKIEISEETSKNLKEQLRDNIKPTPSKEVYTCGYDYMDEKSVNGDWKEKPILIKDKPRQKIFVNKVFASGSEFGSYCVFIKCVFGDNCKLGSYCELSSGSTLGFGCKLQKPYWDENGKHE